MVCALRFASRGWRSSSGGVIIGHPSSHRTDEQRRRRTAARIFFPALRCRGARGVVLSPSPAGQSGRGDPTCLVSSRLVGGSSAPRRPTASGHHYYSPTPHMHMASPLLLLLLPLRLFSLPPVVRTHTGVLVLLYVAREPAVRPTHRPVPYRTLVASESRLTLAGRWGPWRVGLDWMRREGSSMSLTDPACNRTHHKSQPLSRRAKQTYAHTPLSLSLSRLSLSPPSPATRGARAVIGTGRSCVRVVRSLAWAKHETASSSNHVANMVM